MKTADLIDAQLDREVATLEGWAQSGEDGFWRRGSHKRAYAPEYSKQWMWGGPITEREKMEFVQMRNPDYVKARCLYGPWVGGPTPLTAGMRCYVASKLGDEVDVPKELL